MKIKVSRLACAYCLSIDAVELSLIILALSNKLFILPALFGLGFSYEGIGREALYQLRHYNYLKEDTLNLAGRMYYAGIIVLMAIAAIVGSYAGGVVFLVGLVYMGVINKRRYRDGRAEKAVAYDMYMFIPFIFGVIILFYSGI